MKAGITAILASVALSAVSLQSYALEVSFTGQQREVLKLEADKSTGLDNIFVAYDASQLTEMVVSGTDGSLSAMRYSNLGGGYAEAVTVVNDGTTARIANPQGDMGYILQNGDRATYIWLVDYRPHRLELTSLDAYPEQDCDNTRISATGSGAPIYYYTIDGRQCELSRELSLEYRTLEWSDDSENYVQVQTSVTYPHLTDPLTVTPPLYCNSEFTLSGDRFLERWGIGEAVESPVIAANGIAAHTEAVQTNLPDESDETPSNVIKSDSEGLGGSAPAEISFKAYVTDAVLHSEWQIADDENFDSIQYRFNQQNLDYTFTEEGKYYVRYVGSNSDGTCEVYGDVYNVSIGASELRIPNAFSPNDDGVNDVWKVGYRSLISFKCWIFDRYGNQLFYFDDPNSGWDGTYRGKKVKSGVYYYVIEANGSDGEKYKKGGDINIINYSSYGTSSGDSTATTPAE